MEGFPSARMPLCQNSTQYPHLCRPARHTPNYTTPDPHLIGRAAHLPGQPQEVGTASRQGTSRRGAATQGRHLPQPNYRHGPVIGSMGEAAYPEEQAWPRGRGAARGGGGGGFPPDGRRGYGSYRTSSSDSSTRDGGGHHVSMALRATTPLTRDHHSHNHNHTNHINQVSVSLKSAAHLVNDNSQQQRMMYSETAPMMNGGRLIPGETVGPTPNGTLPQDHSRSQVALCQVGIPRDEEAVKSSSQWTQLLQRAFSSRHNRSLRRGRLGCSACGERRLCRHLCACCRRVPRRIFRVLQWCYGINQRQTLCWGLCDLYSIILSIIAVLLIARDQMATHCIGVRYTSEYICSERYVSFECNFPERDFLEDEELFSRCGVHGNGQFKAHLNDSIETICGPNKPLIGSLKLKKYNNDEGKSNYKVPNIVHYTVDCNESKRFDYINYLSFVSVERFLAPDRIYVHCNCFLNTSWWFHTLEEVMNIYVVQREFPEYIQARKPRWVQHRTDVIKLQTLFHNGGFHLDLDVLIIRPMMTLRVHDLVVGEQDEQGQIGDGVILSKPHDPLVCLWMNGFREYDPWPWQRQQYTLYNLQKIVEQFPGKVQVLKHNLLKPGPFEVKEKLYKGNYDWKRNYAIKLWRDDVGVQLPTSEAEANALSSNLGELLRFVGNRTKVTAAPSTTIRPAPRRSKKPRKQIKKKKEPKKKNTKEKEAGPT